MDTTFSQQVLAVSKTKIKSSGAQNFAAIFATTDDSLLRKAQKRVGAGSQSSKGVPGGRNLCS